MKHMYTKGRSAMLVDLLILVAELVCSGSIGNLQMLSKLCCTGNLQLVAA